MHRTKINSQTRINMHTGSPTTRSTQALDACKTETMRLNPQTDLRAWNRGLQPSDFTVPTYKTGDGSICQTSSIHVLRAPYSTIHTGEKIPHVCSKLYQVELLWHSYD
jgi:hypothetical protein